MHIKTPAVGSMGDEYQCDDAAILFHLDVAANRLTVDGLGFDRKLILNISLFNTTEW